MKTLKLDALNVDDLLKASELLKNGEVVGIPTETVYGLAANALDNNAISKIFAAKGRPQDNPLIVHINSFDMLETLACEISDTAMTLLKALWPASLTVVLKKTDIVPSDISRGLDTVAIRFPKHKTALKLISLCGFPLAAPSANTSGKPSTTKASHVFDDLNGKISAVLFDTDCEVGVESTVLDLTGTTPILLRPGAVTPDMIEQIIGPIEIDKAVFEKIDDNAKVLSPGMKYRHYAPKADVFVVLGESQKTAEYIKQNADEHSGILCFDEYSDMLDSANTLSFGSEFDVLSQATSLFEKLRTFDTLEITKIYAQCPSPSGVGLAVSNRLLKASGFNIINV